MSINTNTILAVLLALVVGVSGGYFFAVNNQGLASNMQTISDGSMMHTSMDSMTAGLSGKTGDELDKAFIDEMIVHHEGAVEMAELLLAGTKRPELIKLGNDIITAQTGEIEMMKKWRAEWFGAE